MPKLFPLTGVVLALSALAGLQAAAPAASAPLAAAESPAPGIPLPRLRLDFAAGSVVLSGSVPNEIERAAVLRRLRVLYGADRVTDRLQVGEVGNPSWLSAAFLPDLRGAVHAVAVLDDARLVIDGVAGSALARDAVSASVADAGGKGVRVDNRIEVRP
ncbi:BON domain-containing protein [Ideonella sp. A 288]|uniref:BON domain-containing protein n=1 Tax=Ideonella sp. A 288 TaxID=1962181 RepID=UPI000B4BBC71|nr:BON domain-containing protein [Ideonella sp. A 288]